MTEHNPNATRILRFSRSPAAATSDEGVLGISAIISVAVAECQCQNFPETMRVSPDKTLDCIGLFCPMPILKVREALKPMLVGQTLEMLSDDPASDADMKSWAGRTGHQLLAVERDGAVFRFLVRKIR
jgi:TusA-related sulfurtransferase